MSLSPRFPLCGSAILLPSYVRLGNKRKKGQASVAEHNEKT